MAEQWTIEQFREFQKTGKKPGEETQRPKRHKFGARPTMTEGIRFDSKKEAERYQFLQLRFKAKEIGPVILQYPFELPGGIIYKCDFLYLDFSLKTFVIEDVKGMKTQEYKLKKKLFEETYQYKITEIWNTWHGYETGTGH